MNDGETEYTDELTGFLELLWGEGYLSPGGAEEVALVLDGVDLRGKTVLDLGCGAGGIAASLAADYGAGAVTGVDVEAPVLAKAQALAERKGLLDKVRFEQVTPGPLPFADGSFDVVFSKDAMIHIADKETLFKDLFRVLRPGGCFAASDWLISHDGEPSPEMAHYVKMEELSFGMASPARYESALAEAGFHPVTLTNRNPWYREVAKKEYEALKGPLRERAEAVLGKEGVDHNIGTWEAMIVVLDTGEHCPHHIRASKPT